MSLQLKRIALATLMLAAWELLSRVFGLQFYVSQPSAIAARLAVWTSDGTLLHHTWVTLVEAVVGFVSGSAFGIAAGLLLGRANSADAVLAPFLTAFYSLPKVALAPLFILWFGIEMKMKVIFVGVVVFFPVFLNTYAGVQNVGREQISILRLMGASERQLVSKVILPSAIVWVFAGLRLSIPYALIGALIAEMLASNQGLGYLVSYNSAMFDTAGTMAALVVVVVIALCLNAGVKLAEQWLLPWREVQEQQEVVL
jgi:NitT/TauT family transport system permease protein